MLINTESLSVFLVVNVIANKRINICGILNSKMLIYERILDIFKGDIYETIK